MEALFSLTPAESKRLIAKAVVTIPEVVSARDEGYLVIARGTTNAYIAEELLNEPFDKIQYAAGQMIRGILCVLPAGTRGRPVTFHKGKVIDVDPGTIIDKLGPGDMVLKGANALDSAGNVGVTLASPSGGTMGQFYMAVKAQGVQIIYPVGLEKLIPSVELAAQYGGRLRLTRTIGAPVGMACVADGNVVSEIEAIEHLFDVTAIPLAAGGYGGAEGMVTFVIEGDEEDVNSCMDFIEGIKGEPPLGSVKGPCKTCPEMCSFQGLDEEELPEYLRD